MAVSAIAGLMGAAGFAASAALGLTTIGLTLGTFAAAFAVGAGLSLVSRALMPKPDMGAMMSGTTATVREAASSRKIVYGRARVGGSVIFLSNSGNKNEYLHLVIVYAGHEIDAYEKFYFNDKKIWENGSFVSDWGSYVRINAYDGTQTTADSNLVSESVYWTSDHKVLGSSYIHIRLKWDQKKFPQGVPNISAVIRGKKVYDPRTDTTAWSQNPALCLRDYLLDTRYGLGETSTRINNSSLVAAANLCDESVSLKDGGTQTRYSLDGVVDTSSSLKENIEAMLGAMGGRIVFSGGQYFIAGSAYTTPSVDIDESVTVGEISVQTKQSRRSMYNGVKGVFLSEEKNYILADYPAQISSSYAVEDGDPIYLDMTLPFVTNSVRAQRLAKIALLKSRQQTSVTIPVNLVGLKFKAGDFITVTNDKMGWSAKPFEVLDYSLQQSADGSIIVNLNCIETSASVYDWATSDELDLFDEGELDLYDGTTVTEPSFSLSASSRVDGDGTIRSFIDVSITDISDEFLSNYRIEVTQNSTPSVTRSFTTVATSYSYAVIDSSVSHDVTVTAVNLMGIESTGTAQSVTPVLDTTAPSAPSNVSATGTLKQIIVTWDNPADSDFKHVEIYRSATNTAPQAGTAATFKNDGEELVDGGYTGEVTRYYWVRSVDTSGNKSAWVASGAATTVLAVTNDLGDDIVTADKILANTITSNEIDANSIASAVITAGSIIVTGDNISDLNNDSGFNNTYIDGNGDIQGVSSGAGTSVDNTLNAGKTLALLLNQSVSGVGNSGECALVAVDNEGNIDRTADGYILWNGSKITIDRYQYGDSYTILTNLSNKRGFICFDTTKSDPFTAQSTAMDVAFVYKQGSQWYYDNNSSTPTSFTPTDDMVALGWLETGVADQVVRGGLFGEPVSLTTASFPSDVIESGTVGGIKIEPTKLYEGTGTFNNANTGFYLDSSGQFSLKDKLSFDGTNLSVTGGITATSLTLSGITIPKTDLDSSVQTSLDSADSALQIGDISQIISEGNIPTGKLTFNNAGPRTVTYSGNNITSSGGADNSWNTHVYSSEHYDSPCVLQFEAGYSSSSGLRIMVGLNTDPLTNTSYNSIDYAWYLSSGSATIYTNGSQLVPDGGPFSYNTGDKFSVVYDGDNILFYFNNILKKTILSVGSLDLYMDSSIYDTDTISINDVRFAPISRIDYGSVGSVQITPEKLYQGAGDFNSSNTGFYLDSSGQFSLKNKLSFDGTDLVVDGGVKATTLDVIDATVTGTLNASTVSAGSIKVESLSQGVWNAIDDRFTAVAGSSGGFYETDTGVFVGSEITIATPQVAHNTKDIVFQIAIDQYWGSTTNITGTGLQATVTYEYSTDNVNWSTVTSGATSATTTLTATNYPFTYGGSTSYIYYLLSGYQFTMPYAELAAGNYYFRVRITPLAGTNAFQLSSYLPDGGIPVTYEANEAVSGTVSTSGNANTLDGLDSTQFLRSDADDSTSGSLSVGGNLTVTGDLTVNGTTTTLNTATLDVEDKNITLNFGAGDTSASANGAGITIQDAVDASTDASILWDATNDEFDFSHKVSSPKIALTDNIATTASNGSFDVAKTLVGNIHITNGAGASGSPKEAAITFQGSDASQSQAGIYVVNDNSSGTHMALATTQSYAVGPQIGLSITNSGVVNFPRARPTYNGNGLWASSDFSSSDISNWNTAYGWGNHATAGYLTSIPTPVVGDFWNGGFVQVGTDGVMEVGKYLDFHASDSGGNNDYDLRVTASAGALSVGGTLSSGSFSSSGTVTATSTSAHRLGRISFRDDSIEQHVTDSDTAGIAFNYNGYGNAGAYFRDVNFYDGKQGFVGRVDGSAKTLNIVNGYQVNGTTVIDSSRRLQNVSVDNYIGYTSGGTTQNSLHANAMMQMNAGAGSVLQDGLQFNVALFRAPRMYAKASGVWSDLGLQPQLTNGRTGNNWAGTTLSRSYDEFIFYFGSDLGYTFISALTILHSTSGNSMTIYIESSETGGATDTGWTEIHNTGAVGSWPGSTTITRNFGIGGGYDNLFRIRIVPNFSHASNSISLGQIVIRAGYGGYARLFDWDSSRNVDFYGTVNAVSGYEVNGTTVISASRQLQNIDYIDTDNAYTRAAVYSLNEAGDGWNTVIERNGGSHYVNAIHSYKINGTTVIDSSRNLTNIVSITSKGLVTTVAPSTANDVHLQTWDYSGNGSYSLDIHQRVTSGIVRYSFGQTNNNTVYDDILVFKQGKVGFGTQDPDKQVQINSNDSTTDVTAKGLAGGVAGSGILIYNTNMTAGSYANLDFRSGNADARIAYSFSGTTNVGTFSFVADNGSTPSVLLTLDSGGDLDVKTGGLQINNTTVIDSSRNLTNIGTGSFSGTVTIDGGDLDIRTQNEENPTDVIYFGANNGASTNDSDDIGTGIVWAPKYTGYTKRSAGIMQIGEGNYFKSGLAFYTNGTSNKTTDWSERMRISMDGKIGANTTSPLTQFHVYSSVSGTDTASRTTPIDVLTLETENTGTFEYNGFGQGIVFRGSTYNNSAQRTLGRILHQISDDSNAITRGTTLSFQTSDDPTNSAAPTTKLKIDYDGNVDVSYGALTVNGTTVIDSNRNLRNIANIHNSFNTEVIELDNSTYTILCDPDGGRRIYLGDTGDAGNYYDNTSHYFRTRGGVVFAKINSDGIITNGDVTAYGSPSDETLKENVELIGNAINKVKQLRGVTFNYIGDDNKMTGLIAQDLQKVLPEVVYTTEDEKLAVRYGNTVGLLVEAIKEQQSEIDELKSLVKQLLEK